MDQHYKVALDRAKRLENDIKNLLDDRDHPIGLGLLQESRQLVSEVSAQRKPRLLEDRIKSLLNLLHDAKRQGEAVMDQRHIAELRENYEQLQMQLRKFDNY